ncbi:hypothetical protein HpHNI55_04840 [Helicobacter pylori]
MINRVFATLNFLLASKETLEQQDKEFSLSGIKELKEKHLYPSDKTIAISITKPPQYPLKFVFSLQKS